MLPSKDPEPERYAGRPLLVVLEHYVLAVIGELTPEKSHAMRAVVQKVFGGGDDWKGTVRQRLAVTDDIDAEILTLWRKNHQLAAQSGVDLHPVQFAKMFADENFAPLFESGQK
jgi:hypothetical protein